MIPVRGYMNLSFDWNLFVDLSNKNLQKLGQNPTGNPHLHHESPWNLMSVGEIEIGSVNLGEVEVTKPSFEL